MRLNARSLETLRYNLITTIPNKKIKIMYFCTKKLPIID